jgi:hypothetical protein
MEIDGYRESSLRKTTTREKEQEKQRWHNARW